MRIRSTRTPLALKSKVVKIRVIGGDTDYCQDAFSFTPDKEGIASSFAPTARTPAQTAANIERAIYLPRYNYSIMINQGNALVRLAHGTEERFASFGTMFSPTTFMVDYFREGVAHYAFMGKAVVEELSEGDVRTAITIPHWLRCGVLRKNRLIGADGLDPLIVRWSSHLCTDWTEGAGNSGYLYLEPDGGKVVGAAEYDDEVVFIREYGITIMHARGDPRNFSVEPTMLVNAANPALVNSTCKAVGKLWFLSRDTLYVYDGTVREVPLAKFTKGWEFVRAQSYDERYIYVLCTKDDDRCYMEYDAQTGACTMFAKNVTAFWRSSFEDLGTQNNVVVDMKKDVPDENRFWLSEQFDLQTDRIKNLREVEIDCDETIEVEAIVDGKMACTLKGGKHKLFLHGKAFSFKVKGVGRIRSLDAAWEVGV